MSTIEPPFERPTTSMDMSGASRSNPAEAAEDVLSRTARVLGEGVGAERAEVRLAVSGEMRPVATWPDDAPDRPDDHVAEVRYQGELLGALAVSLPANDPIDATREQLVQHLASQAGLVLRNERLAEQLACVFALFG